MSTTNVTDMQVYLEEGMHKQFGLSRSKHHYVIDMTAVKCCGEFV